MSSSSAALPIPQLKIMDGKQILNLDNLPTTQILAIISSIKGSLCLTTNGFDNPLSLIASQAIADAIAHNDALTELTLDDVLFEGTNGITDFFQKIVQNSAIKSLHLEHSENAYWNNDDTSLIENILAIIETSRSLVEFSLSDVNPLTNKTFGKIMTFIAENNQLTRFSLRETLLTPAFFIGLAHAISKNTTLTELDLSYVDTYTHDNDCSDMIDKLAAAFQKNKTLQKIDFNLSDEFWNNANKTESTRYARQQLVNKIINSMKGNARLTHIDGLESDDLSANNTIKEITERNIQLRIIEEKITLAKMAMQNSSSRNAGLIEFVDSTIATAISTCANICTTTISHPEYTALNDIYSQLKQDITLLGNNARPARPSPIGVTSSSSFTANIGNASNNKRAADSNNNSNSSSSSSNNNKRPKAH